MALEIERKYLLLPLRIKYFLDMFVITYKTADITQSYLERDGKTGRIRQYNDKFYITLKKGEGLVREEYEKEITNKMYSNMLSSSDKVGTVKKIRYLVKVNGFTYEIDEFEENLEGLVLLEVEFNSEKESLTFELDERFKKVVIKEVTNDVEFSNRSIALSQKIQHL